MRLMLCAWLGAAFTLSHAAPTVGTVQGPALSPSGHYVTYCGRTVMLQGDSGTQVVPMNGRLSLGAWLDQCRREGHSTVHVWAFTGPRKDDWRLGDGPALLPWPRRSDDRWDLSRFDEGTDPAKHYWPRLRALCRMARLRGLLVGITVFYGWAKEGGPGPGWQVHPFNTANGGFATRSADIVRLSDDREIHREVWDEAWPASRKAQWLWEGLALKLIDTARAEGNVWFDYRDEWSYLNREAAQSEAHWRRFFTSRGCLWADRSGLGGLRVANPDVPPYGDTPTIKTEGEPYDHEAVRGEVWSRAMRGIHYLLHNDAREPNVAAWDPGAARTRGVRPEDDKGRAYVGLCSRFFNKHVRTLDSLRPAPPSQPGVLWMSGPMERIAYAEPSVGQIVVELPDGERWSASAYDPRTGALTRITGVRSGQTVTYRRPIGSADWVLLLRSERDVDRPAEMGDAER